MIKLFTMKLFGLLWFYDCEIWSSAAINNVFSDENSEWGLNEGK